MKKLILIGILLTSAFAVYSQIWSQLTSADKVASCCREHCAIEVSSVHTSPVNSANWLKRVDGNHLKLIRRNLRLPT